MLHTRLNELCLNLASSSKGIVVFEWICDYAKSVIQCHIYESPQVLGMKDITNTFWILRLYHQSWETHCFFPSSNCPNPPGWMLLWAWRPLKVLLRGHLPLSYSAQKLPCLENIVCLQHWCEAEHSHNLVRQYLTVIVGLISLFYLLLRLMVEIYVELHNGWFYLTSLSKWIKAEYIIQSSLFCNVDAENIAS